MSRVRFYIKTFASTDNYAAEFEEITTDVLSVNKIKNDLDNNDYDIGIFKSSNISISLRNDHGRFSDETNLKTMFPVQRDESIVKITWDRTNFDVLPGFFTTPTLLGGEEILFEGLLNDVGEVSAIDQQNIKFTVIGFESLFDREEVPFSTISAGELASSIIFKSLNQAKVTDLLTVSAGNITLGQDEELDAIADLENATIKEALDELLRISNSVLSIVDRVVHITSRAESSDLKFTFYGQASDNGIENVVDITKDRDGKNRIFNFWTWEDTTLVSTDATSKDKYGIRKRKISSDFYTVTAKRQRLLDSGRDEFKNPKREMLLTAPLSYDTLALNLLDKVSVDYPTIYVSADGNPMAVYGQGVYGAVKAPFGQYSLTIEASARFKILSKTIDLKKSLISFELRETG